MIKKCSLSALILVISLSVFLSGCGLVVTEMLKGESVHRQSWDPPLANSEMIVGNLSFWKMSLSMSDVIDNQASAHAVDATNFFVPLPPVRRVNVIDFDILNIRQEMVAKMEIFLKKKGFAYDFTSWDNGDRRIKKVFFIGRLTQIETTLYPLPGGLYRLHMHIVSPDSKDYLLIIKDKLNLQLSPASKRVFGKLFE